MLSTRPPMEPESGSALAPWDGLNPLTAAVCNGIRAGEFRVAYQSIVDNTLGKTHGAEALVRWQHPDFGLLLPGNFADALADRATARRISYFVLERVCLDLGELPSVRSGRFYVTVNIPPSLLLDPMLPHVILKLCEQHNVAPGVLMLELLEGEDTETNPNLGSCADLLRRVGVRLALDDFGTGFSSLARLDRLHIDVVKLAREMIQNIPTSARACRLTAGVITLLRNLQLGIIVEGVETAEQVLWLRKYPDVCLQGFHLRRPVANLQQALQNISPDAGFRPKYSNRH